MCFVGPDDTNSSLSRPARAAGEQAAGSRQQAAGSRQQAACRRKQAEVGLQMIKRMI